MDTNRPTRQLPIDLSELALVFDNRDQGFSHYLDLGTGQVISISEDAQRHLEEIYDEYFDEETDQPQFEAILAQMDLYDWQREELLLAKQIDGDLSQRYLRVPVIESRAGYRDMVSFIDTVQNPRLKTRLERAIAGSGAFRAFKDLLADYPKERQRWFEFKENCLQERVRRWLADEGIEPVGFASPAR